MKLKLTAKQEKQIDVLKQEGIQIKNKYLKAKIDLETAINQEQQAKQCVLDNNIFVCAEYIEGTRGHNKGDRITNPKLDFLIDEEIFENEFMPKLQQAYKVLFNIENPLEFDYVYPFKQNFWELEKQFLKIATRFLSLAGQEQTAEQLNKKIDGYLKDSFKEQLLKINNDFLGMEA